jgi:hypothetical protein
MLTKVSAALAGACLMLAVAPSIAPPAKRLPR